MAKTRRMPSPFKYRGRWRAQVTLSNGRRPHVDFDTMQEAKAWIAEMLAADTTHSPELGGPTQAKLAAALNFYAGQHTVAKDGYKSELTRINHYLEGAKMPLLKCTVSAEGQRKLVAYTPGNTLLWQSIDDMRAEHLAQRDEMARLATRLSEWQVPEAGRMMLSQLGESVRGLFADLDEHMQVEDDDLFRRFDTDRPLRSQDARRPRD